MRLLLLVTTVAIWTTFSAAIPLADSGRQSQVERRVSLGGSLTPGKPAAAKPAPAAPKKPKPPKATHSRTPKVTIVKSRPTPATKTSKAKTTSHVKTTSGKHSTVTHTTSTTRISTDPIDRIAWPQPTINGASPPTLDQARKLKKMLFPKTPPLKFNASLFTPEQIAEENSPPELQRRFVLDDHTDYPTTAGPQSLEDANSDLDGGLEESSAAELERRGGPRPGAVCPKTTADFTTQGLFFDIPESKAAFYASVDTNAQTPEHVTWAHDPKRNLGVLKDFLKWTEKIDAQKLQRCDKFWSLASTAYAELASGAVAVLLPPLGQNQDPKSWPDKFNGGKTIWEIDEWPALQHNTKVCSVWRFDINDNAVPLLTRDTPECKDLVANPIAPK